MAQLVRNLLDGYHDIMNNQSGGLILWRCDCACVITEGRVD